MHGLVRASCIFKSTLFIILMHTVYKKIKYPASSFHFSIKQTFLLFSTSKKGSLVDLGSSARFHSILADFEGKRSTSHEAKILFYH